MRGVEASALGMTGAAGAYETLVALLGSDEHSLMAGAIDGLAELGDSRALPLQALLASNRLDERTARRQAGPDQPAQPPLTDGNTVLQRRSARTALCTVYKEAVQPTEPGSYAPAFGSFAWPQR